jgi:hypothetical protein
MSKRAHAALAVVAAALLMHAFAVGAAAQRQPSSGQQQPGYDERGEERGPNDRPMAPAAEPMVTLTGMLQRGDDHGWVLVDQASGDSIELKRKSGKLAKHADSNVTVTGRWKKDDETTKTFKVSKVEAAAADATEPTEAAAPAQTPTDSPSLPSTPEDPAAPTDPSTTPEQPATPQDPATPEDPAVPDQQPLPETPESPSPNTP